MVYIIVLQSNSMYMLKRNYPSTDLHFYMSVKQPTVEGSVSIHY